MKYLLYFVLPKIKKKIYAIGNMGKIIKRYN